MQLPFQVLSTVHTGITVADLPKANAFFTQVLGFKPVSEGHLASGEFIDNLVGVPEAELDYVVIEAPGHRIELLEYLAPRERFIIKPRSCDVGSVHLAFCVAGLDALLARAKAFGWHAVGHVQTVTNGPKNGTRAVYVRSEDGVTIEFQEPPSQHT